MYYAPQTITHLDARARIDAAYRHAGLTPPSIVDDIDALLTTEPTPSDLALEYAHDALDGTRKPAELVAEAIERITRAQAVELFAATYRNTVEAVAVERIDGTRDTAITDLRPMFDKTVKHLTTAAVKLTGPAPLDRDAAFTADTTREVKAAAAALADLAELTILPVTIHPEVAGPVTSLLRIVNVPDVTVEQYGLTAMQAHKPIPDDDTPTRAQVREFHRAARDDADTTLVRVARGDWPALTLNMADTTELRRRITATVDALRRRRITA